ncbi:MAG TPA: hypothetical protein VLN26_17355, partial [Gaiellaceae bacterium]|nr:hypothetical protein [Gaiellaceae bacterium]
LALDAEEALARASATPDRIEREGLEFMRAVDAAYRELAAVFGQRVVVLDATRQPEETAREIRGHLGLS